MADNASSISQNKPLLTEFPKNTKEDWRNATDKLLKGKPFEKIMLTRTYEDIQLQPIYDKEDFDTLLLTDNLPGFPFYLRNTKTLGYLEQEWKISQEISYATAERFRDALLHDLDCGQTGVNIKLDKASLEGRDPDQAEKEKVGSQGTSLFSLAELEIALDKVVLDCIDIDIYAPITAPYMLSMLVALAKKKGCDSSKLSGCVGMDPLGFLSENGKIYDIEQIYDEMAETIKWSKEQSPHIRTINISSASYHNSGASDVDELAFVFSVAVEYIRALQKRDIDIQTIASKIQFSLSLGSNFFMQIAKLRAARLIWSKIVEAFGGDIHTQKMYIHARTSQFNKTKYDPYVNMLRTTTEAFSGILGGCDSLYVAPFDEVFGHASEFSRRIARNQQLILKNESHLDHVIDPAGGSWYIETLTSTLTKKIWEQFQDIEKKQGMLSVLKNEYIQETIEKTANKRRENIFKRKDVIIGTNMYANLKEEPLNKEFDKEEQYKELCKKVHRVSLEDIKKETFIDSLILAFEKGATLGQMVEFFQKEKDILEIRPLSLHRLAEPFEVLREGVEKYIAEGNTAPKVFLANMGPVSQHKARADFSLTFFEVGGFEVINNQGFKTPEEAVEEALKSDSKVFVICSTDPTYPEIVPLFTKKLKERSSDAIVILAGYPKDQIEEHKQSGVDYFIHLRANAYEILSSLLKKLGVQ